MVVSTFGGAAGLLVGCSGGTLIAGTWQGGGAFVVAGIWLVIKGAREFVFAARKRAILSRYAPDGSGVPYLLRVHLPPCLLAMSAFVIACMKRKLCQAVYLSASTSVNLAMA